MKRYDLIVVGAGPAGLSAAIEGAKRGLKTVIFDENEKPGGQLFKQIHKFFGSKEHRAKIRGFKIGEELLAEAAGLGVEVVLNAAVIGLYQEKEVVVRIGEAVRHYKGDAVIVATGATENAVYFEGWDLPGVIGAGAAQTMMNLHGVRPGEKVLMLGAGNVGLVVSFQLLQAGCEVVAVADAASAVGGYGVHAAKVARTGVSFYLSHTIIKAEGGDRVNAVTIAEVDERFQFIPGTEKRFEVDTVCLAVGLSPMCQLLKMAGCRVLEIPAKGGQVPLVGTRGETSADGIFAAGDVSGIEEASSAMIEGRIAGIAAAEYLGYAVNAELEAAIAENEAALSELRQGMFAPGRRGDMVEFTDEGIHVSVSLLKKGYVNDEEIARFTSASETPGFRPIIECTQNIPCNPCRDVCPRNCIKVESITALPRLNEYNACSGCGLCVASCPGQAIFLVNGDVGGGFANVTLPYEFLPLPKEGDRGVALGRDGQVVCEAWVSKAQISSAFDKTNLLTIKVPAEMAGKARFFKSKGAV
ncbi:MAG: FAD-dependent oxidoreductase [Clostridiales bacterium]|jgi:thioredoxin reductase/Pyruvate/2-oxoacid:ferredoxin oxidoreductase delta subunit|nr:FAD-dependent oxidoreductase [Clostridiales bacterium]